MPNGLQFLSALFLGNAFPNLFLPTGFSLTPSAEAMAPPIPSFTPGQEAARAAELREREFQFRRETFATELTEARRAEREALIRIEEERRRGEAAEARSLVREEQRQTRVIERENDLLAERRAFEVELRRREVEDRNRAAESAEVLRFADAQRRNFDAALRGAPRGTVPVLSPSGAISFIRVGESQTEEQLRLGAEIQRFAPPAATASRFTTVPGVFVGPGFRFANVVEARNFLTTSRTSGTRRVRARGSSRAFVGGIL